MCTERVNFTTFCHNSLFLYSYNCSLFLSQKLLDRFDYDDEPETGEETKKDETSSQATL